MTLARLKQTIHCLEESDPLPSDCAEWLYRGLSQYYLKGKGLESILELKASAGPGGYFLQPIQLEHHGQRNQLIQALAELVPGKSPREKSKVIVKLMRSRSMLPKDVHKDVPALLDRLMHCIVRPPSSARQMERIIQGESVTADFH